MGRQWTEALVIGSVIGVLVVLLRDFFGHGSLVVQIAVFCGMALLLIVLQFIVSRWRRRRGDE